MNLLELQRKYKKLTKILIHTRILFCHFPTLCKLIPIFTVFLRLNHCFVMVLYEKFVWQNEVMVIIQKLIRGFNRFN